MQRPLMVRIRGRHRIWSKLIYCLNDFETLYYISLVRKTILNKSINVKCVDPGWPNGLTRIYKLDKTDWITIPTYITHMKQKEIQNA
jgi:hypothetical protein